MTGSDPDDDRDESTDDRAYEDDHWLSSLLSALESLESGSESISGRRRTDRAIFDYDVSIRSGDDISADESPIDGDQFGARPGDRAPDRTDDRSRKRRIRSSGPSSDHTVATRAYDDELVVTADVAGVDPDDVAVGFDDSMLVIGVGGTELDRIEVPWTETESQATIKNGVLTVRIGPESTDSEHSVGAEDEE